MAAPFHLPVTAAQVGTYFVGQYHRVLQQQPNFVHQFYSEASTMLRIDGNSRETTTAMLKKKKKKKKEMRTSLKKLLHRHGEARDKRDHCLQQSREEIASASQDMQDMRDCYDNLLSAAAATANSAYDY